MNFQLEDFYIVQLDSDSCCVSKNAGTTNLLVDISEISKRSPITTREQYNEIKQSGRFWLAGGGAYLINERYLVLIKRSDDAYTNPGFLSIATGRSDCFAELLNPHLIIRELFEEIAIFQGGQLILPKIVDPEFSIRDDSILDISIRALKKININPQNILWKEARLAKHINKDLLKISNGLDVIEDSVCCLCVAENSLDINLLYVIEISDLDLENLQILDMELDEKNATKSLNREIYLMDLKNDLLVYKTTPKGILESIAIDCSRNVKITEHASLLIERLKNGI